MLTNFAVKAQFLFKYSMYVLEKYKIFLDFSVKDNYSNSRYNKYYHVKKNQHFYH